MTRPRPDRAQLLATVLASACVLSVIGWTALVHLRVQPFFLVATCFCAGWIGLTVIALGPARLRELLRPRSPLGDVLLGLGTALVLFVGARAFLWALTGGWTDVLREPVTRVYAAFGGGSLAVALALGLVIAPSEELFWRGLVLDSLSKRVPRAWLTVTVMSLASSLVLLVFFEPVLALAALPTSLVWGGLTAWRRSLWPALISHSVWDLLIFVGAPPP